MPSHHESRRLAYTPEQLFDLVADVGRYPEFLPWVVAARVSVSTPTDLTAEMVVGFQFVSERFTSRVTLDRPNTISVNYSNGPLKYLHNEWRFRPTEDGGTMVDLMVAFEFKSRIFERLAGAFFGDAFRTMVASFEKRAARLYPAGTQPSPSPTGINSSSAQITA